jgi:hypothetical protein
MILVYLHITTILRYVFTHNTHYVQFGTPNTNPSQKS